MNLSKNVTDFAKAALSIMGLSVMVGCASTKGDVKGAENDQDGPVNTTKYVPAVDKKEVAISRCEDNGIHVVNNTPYNMDQFERANYRWMADNGIQKEQFGPFLLYYPQSIHQRDSNAGKAVGALIGGAVGSLIGGGNGRTVAIVGGAIAGSEVAGPKIDRAFEKNTRNDRAEMLKLVASCKSDLGTLLREGYSQAAGAPTGRYLPPDPHQNGFNARCPNGNCNFIQPPAYIPPYRNWGYYR